MTTNDSPFLRKNIRKSECDQLGISKPELYRVQNELK
jgi:hypothetical protein